MFRKTIITLAMTGSIFCLALQAGAGTLDPRVAGNTASGWSYADAVDVVPSQLDVSLITGSLDMNTNTLMFTFLTVDNRIEPDFTYNESWAITLDLDNDGLQDATAGAWGSVVDYSTFPFTTKWTSLEAGLLSSSFQWFTDSVIISAEITPAQAATIYQDGFQFFFNVGANDLYADDGVDGDPAWLYVVPEPASLLLIGSGLGGLLIPGMRRRRQAKK